MDNQNSIIVCSLILNVALIIERCFKRVKKSSCMGSNLEFNNDNNNVSQRINKAIIKLDSKIDNV